MTRYAIRSAVSQDADCLAASKLDCCMVYLPETGIYFWEVSNHDYSYSMGIGDAWSVAVADGRVRKDGTREMRMGCRYNYGVGEPRYPVPAIHHHIELGRELLLFTDQGAWKL